MSKHPAYTALGFVVWKVAALVGRRKAKKLVGTPELIVGAVVLAGVVAGGATLAISDSSDD